MDNKEKLESVKEMVLNKKISTGDRLQLWFNGYGTTVDEENKVIEVFLLAE